MWLCIRQPLYSFSIYCLINIFMIPFYMEVTLCQKKNNNFFKLEMLFLKILSIRDCYGYEITHSIKELTNGKIDIKEGSMYPVLYKFEDLGYISSEKKFVGKRMTRIYYHLEPSGKEYLEGIYKEYKEMTSIIDTFMEEEHDLQ